jgi:predicted Zn-dependent protease
MLLLSNNYIFRYTAFLVLISISGCVVNPVTGKKQIALMSEQQEIALGAQSDPQIIAEFGLYDNPDLQKFIDKHGQEMVKISHRPNIKYQFKVLDSPVVNAFAVPGGYVYFTRGIMAHFNNEAAFMGVLGHEIGHITHRHSVEQYSKSTIANVLLLGGLIVSKELRPFANEAQTAMQLLFLKYSRTNETQSDALGAEYSTKIGYDAKEMAGFFQTLNSLSDTGDGKIPTFLSTHPDPLDRFENVNLLATEWQAKVQTPPYKVNGDAYLKMIDGIVYGEDPRQGYVETGVFYHPELKFQFPVPSGWDLANSPSQVQMVPSDGKALLIFTLAEGDNLQSAASATASQLQLIVKSSRELIVHGLQALEVMSEQISEDPATGEQSAIKVKSMYIKMASSIYVFHGVSTIADFAAYESAMDRTMVGFNELIDQSKINTRPERIKVVPVKAEGTLGQALLAYNLPTNRHRELGIVNGMDVTDKVKAGKLIKIVARE